MSRRIRERTLYDYICMVFRERGWSCRSQVGVKRREPDLIFEYGGSMVVSEVKIDSEVKLTDAIVDASMKARLLNERNAMALLFPREVRQISPSELEKVYPNLEVTALILTDWMSDRKSLTLSSLAELLTDSYKEWLRARVTRVNYDFVVDVARDSIREVASYLRFHLSKKPILDSAMGVIGRFDVYKSLLEDFSGVTEEEAKLYVADIAAYILVNQLLFYQIIAEKLGFDKLPDVNPVAPPEDFLVVLDKQFERAREMYQHILGLNLFPLLEETKDQRIIRSVAKIVSTFKALRPEHIREDLFGRLYHETIPPETRKNLGAFYTKPEAAKLLAILAIDRWDARVLDPACGSGTLLVEAYQRKRQLTPPEFLGDCHRKFVEEDIFGIDIMHFAAHMTSTNLTSQNLQTHVFPNVFPGDGIEAMIRAAEEVSDDPPMEQQPISKWLEAVPKVTIPRDLDVVIMNPPFTRRERIPDDLERLGKMVPEVKGKTGYWAYFIIPADKILKEGGVLAVVIPEEFFVGRSAKSIREYLFKKGYTIEHIVRSAVEIAFSEATLYRDYLIVMRKKQSSSPLIVTIFKKKIDEIRDKIEELALEIKDFINSPYNELKLAELESLKVLNSGDFILKHISNLKPLIGFNTVEAHTLALELLNRIKNNPTIVDLENKKLIKIRVYNPGQYKSRGVEKYARKLFTSKYGTRSPNVIFFINNVDEKVVNLIIRKLQLVITLPVAAVIPSLRTYSKVKHLDISNEEEFAIIDPTEIPSDKLKLAGLIPLNESIKAGNDIRSAYNNLAGNVLILRRNQLSSPDLYWLSFFSEKPVLGITSALLNLRTTDLTTAKILTLYFNSVITLLQLISFVAETRGAWVTLHGRQVWSHVHVPDITALNDVKISKALNLFSTIGKLDVKPLLQRLKEHDIIQRSIDEMALEMVGLEDWKDRLDEIYDAVTKELETMHKILETSRGTRRRRR
ncbi:N-6 DNA methylase [Candidatus Bathyarchaeota archaeon]|nr:N-6 DNA methylase [Candidatus Bathyarchaeota archaeon]